MHKKTPPAVVPKAKQVEILCPRYRSAIRIFFIVTVVVIVADIIPPNWPGASRPKQWLSSFLNRVGLWQGQWMMFTPNPMINNAYLTAEIENEDGTKVFWDSPDWKFAVSWKKFYRFRHMNFYNRIYLPGSSSATNDFADYLARTVSNSTVRKLTLVRVPMTMVIPEAGSFPRRDDTIWISSSNFVTERIYDPR